MPESSVWSGFLGHLSGPDHSPEFLLSPRSENLEKPRALGSALSLDRLPRPLFPTSSGALHLFRQKSHTAGGAGPGDPAVSCIPAGLSWQHLGRCRTESVSARRERWRERELNQNGGGGELTVITLCWGLTRALGNDRATSLIPAFPNLPQTLATPPNSGDSFVVTLVGKPIKSFLASGCPFHITKQGFISK